MAAVMSITAFITDPPAAAIITGPAVVLAAAPMSMGAFLTGLAAALIITGPAARMSIMTSPIGPAAPMSITTCPNRPAATVIDRAVVINDQVTVVVISGLEAAIIAVTATTITLGGIIQATAMAWALV
jgi:hypothetical protein